MCKGLVSRLVRYWRWALPRTTVSIMVASHSAIWRWTDQHYVSYFLLLFCVLTLFERELIWHNCFKISHKTLIVWATRLKVKWLAPMKQRIHLMEFELTPDRLRVTFTKYNHVWISSLCNTLTRLPIHLEVKYNWSLIQKTRIMFNKFKSNKSCFTSVSPSSK